MIHYLSTLWYTTKTTVTYISQIEIDIETVTYSSSQPNYTGSIGLICFTSLSTNYIFDLCRQSHEWNGSNSSTGPFSYGIGNHTWVRIYKIYFLKNPKLHEWINSGYDGTVIFQRLISVTVHIYYTSHGLIYTRANKTIKSNQRKHSNSSYLSRQILLCLLGKI